MAELNNDLERRLIDSGGSWVHGARGPAPAFLAAVRRRRTVRRARAAGLGALAVAAVVGAVWLARVAQHPAGPQDHREMAGGGNSRKDNAVTPAPRAPTVMPTIAQLTNLNRAASIENTRLPEAGGTRGTERPMRLLDSRNPAVFEPAFSGI